MKSKRGTGRLVAGLILIVLGGLFLLDTLDVLDFGDVIGWAVSIAFIAFGLGILVTQRFRNVIFPIVLIGVGIFLLLGNLDVDAYRYWPIILVVVGAAIIFGGTRRRSRNRKRDVAGSSSTTTSEGEVNISCTMSETNERVDSSEFVGGTVSVTLGNANVDLRDAMIANPPANLDVSLTMAGLNLRVPSDWHVTTEIDVTMGEAEDKRSRSGSSTDMPHLVITGSVTMGNLAIND